MHEAARPQRDEAQGELEQAAAFPGAVRPARRRTVDRYGVRLAVYEWGDAGAPPLLLAHGGFDFAGTFDVFAPLLAAGGWRVVTWDQRGHGDSAHTALYSWEADTRDALSVLDSTTREPAPLVGHSKGGSLFTHLTEACPHRVACLVNLDGLPSRRPSPDVSDHERTKLLAADITGWLDHRRRVSSLERKAAALADLAARRGRMNPRLTPEWLRYLVTIGARHDADGWRWKIDPALRFGGFGPWRPDWYLERLPGLAVPMLGVLGLVPEVMGWGTTADSVRAFLPPGAELVELADTGHFLHIEKPREIADLVLRFLASACRP
ncbi:MAG: alpha/beta hydrolase [Deltaproteobacteria bacterium]|nr:alpha/beta hydrolase [Deltaproteobacteria bacterium]